MTTNRALPSGNPSAYYENKSAAAQGRTDIHRPTVFDPEAYDFGWAGTWSTDEFMADIRKDAARMLRLALADGYSIARHQSSGQCGHCGARLMHYAAMLHLASKEIIYVGETCLDNRFEMATREFQAWRKMRAGARARDAKAARVVALLDNHPFLAELGKYAEDNDFIRSLATQLMDRGELSEKQIAAAEKAVTRAKDRAEARAKEDAARESLAPLTAGKRTITGTVIHTKWQDSGFGYGSSGSLKGMIQDAEGYKFWGTLPSGWQGEKGDTITLTATITPKDEDPTFAFYKRPRLV